MGKGVDQSEYEKANRQIKSCRAANCPNAGEDPEAENAEFCVPCKNARRITREYERANPSRFAPLPERRK